MKYRLWDKVAKCMENFYQLAVNPSGEIYYPHNVTDRYDQLLFSGLYDMNNVEIYDADILKIVDCGEEIFSSVWFDDGAFWVDFEGNSRELLIDNCMSAEIVGNIYENPEILENQLPLY